MPLELGNLGYVSTWQRKKIKIRTLHFYQRLYQAVSAGLSLLVGTLASQVFGEKKIWIVLLHLWCRFVRCSGQTSRIVRKQILGRKRVDSALCRVRGTLEVLVGLGGACSVLWDHCPYWRQTFEHGVL